MAPDIATIAQALLELDGRIKVLLGPTFLTYHLVPLP